MHSLVNTEIMRGLPMDMAALASGLNNTGRHLAMTLGASVASIIFAVDLHVAGYRGEILSADPSLVTHATTIALLFATGICIVGFILKVAMTISHKARGIE